MVLKRYIIFNKKQMPLGTLQSKSSICFLFYIIKKDILKERNFEDSLSFASYSIDFQFQIV